jgi:hypothetical protein
VSRAEARARLREALAPLNRRSSAELADLLFGLPPAVPKRHRLCQLIAVAAVACPLGIFFSVWFLWPSLALWSTSIFLHSYHGPTMRRHASALASLAAMLSCVPKASSFSNGTELPDAGAVRFDYRLSAGPCQSRNAIKLLAIAGYPREVTDLANETVDRTGRGSSVSGSEVAERGGFEPPFPTATLNPSFS